MPTMITYGRAWVNGYGIRSRAGPVPPGDAKMIVGQVRHRGVHRRRLLPTRCCRLRPVEYVIVVHLISVQPTVGRVLAAVARLHGRVAPEHIDSRPAVDDVAALSSGECV